MYIYNITLCRIEFAHWMYWLLCISKSQHINRCSIIRMNSHIHRCQFLSQADHLVESLQSAARSRGLGSTCEDRHREAGKRLDCRYHWCSKYTALYIYNYIYIHIYIYIDYIYDDSNDDNNSDDNDDNVPNNDNGNNTKHTYIYMHVYIYTHEYYMYTLLLLLLSFIAIIRRIYPSLGISNVDL